ncbi:2,3-bisphosphoglycerate-dependent phosphoglycerate mutase [Companilactobacillus sp.]|jgi:2,3-bisphosphoglycerate-dependent phosphoglycerate mutase|uniref:2,3-bisphosphoglycerate-dependent phosphoglycerate mutase n=1 Tax=Companilactobacillus sp. TaxID=2767905 RepID=UPI0025BA0E48|nr:2,3-bisphosphoglycerate-dependent phosphoglycerate mutase [Companilactobacillus sp.]MCH4010225.1 2,3-bisphosphoglycerate-dependent phosphoglycerate mutase [Companilactobacillus sp.]MCH4052099.1 2,3-bisphosphoglycerate-dependent phosphoglycerate mutase [Companilactobacillus sp.]MCH4078167.1 2,3-bisphosphoglycerate-dependent phosphoglycerate mutase [Companilactobacillus sp.]MCH4126743.1 2,3-bisphosphoglycerate-dependent phosphoglycerate mutase [Companilactobacillus sp.]MCH4132328.1 2,3-bispho
MVKLILVRHGESVANAENHYTGWNDVDLTAKGVEQTHQTAQKLAGYDIDIRHVWTSVLKRAIASAYIIQDDLDLNYLPITKAWQLNERHYGALRGQNKDVTRQEYGVKQVQIWRRSFYAFPPKLDAPDPRVGPYKNVDPRAMPLSESLYVAYLRIIPYYIDHIVPELLDGKDQLVVAHGSTIRAMIKYLEDIGDKDIDGVEVANGEPLVYEFDSKLNLLKTNRK